MNSLGVFTAAALLGATAVAGASSRCSAEVLEQLLPENAVLETVANVTANGTFGEGAPDIAYPTNPTGLPELCALIVNVTSSSTSSYRFGLFLPEEWNSRFLAVGNGGFAGGINWLDMGAGAHYRFATVSTDTGHNSTSGDVTWALHQEEKKYDFGYRAMQGSVGLAKEITKGYYGAAAAYSYYSGCSTGGRQGLKEAQVSPDHFDGVLVGAPAWYTSHMQPWTTKVGIYNLPENGTNHISTDLFTVIAAEVINQCDEIDGVKDGIVSRPDICNFNSTTLSCDLPTANASACLTATQLETLANIYSDYYVNGTFAFPGPLLSSEPQWFAVLSGDTPSTLGYEYVQYFVLDEADWAWEQYNDSIIPTAEKMDPGNCTADDYDMSAIRDNGAKIILYHGMADGLIPTYSSKVFYERAADAMGGVEELSDWFRFFFVPGMGHCDSTAVDAPWYFAGANQAGSLSTSAYSTPGFMDAEHDALLALMRWVENGTAVDTLIATTWTDSSDPDSGVLRQRPLCPYPSMAQWDQVGDPDVATSWSCVEE